MLHYSRVLLLSITIALSTHSAFTTECNSNLPTLPPNGDPCADEPELSQLNFGKVVRPSFGAAQISIDYNGIMQQGQTNLINLSSGTKSSGKSKIRGANASLINIDFIDQAPNGFNFTNFNARYGKSDYFEDDGETGSTFGPYNANPNGTSLSFGATLQVYSTVTPGIYNVPYEILVLYSNCTTCTTSSISRNAKIEVVIPVTLSESTKMDFGTITKPETGMDVIRLNTDGSREIISGSGNTALIGGSIATAAVFNLEAQANEILQTSFSVDPTPIGITLGNFTGSYNNGSQHIGAGNGNTLTATSGTGSLMVGAELSVDHTAPEGVHNLGYEIEVNYQ